MESSCRDKTDRVRAETTAAICDIVHRRLLLQRARCRFERQDTKKELSVAEGLARAIEKRLFRAAKGNTEKYSDPLTLERRVRTQALVFYGSASRRTKQSNSRPYIHPADEVRMLREEHLRQRKKLLAVRAKQTMVAANLPISAASATTKVVPSLPAQPFSYANSTPLFEPVATSIERRAKVEEYRRLVTLRLAIRDAAFLATARQGTQRNATTRRSTNKSAAVMLGATLPPLKRKMFANNCA